MFNKNIKNAAKEEEEEERKQLLLVVSSLPLKHFSVLGSTES